MKKRSLCLVLALALCLGAAHAAGEELFPAVNAYPGYADVKETTWYYDNIKLCNEVGLMNGTDKGFEPEKTLTVAECAAVAARIRENLTGEAIPGVTPLPGETLPWYQQYLGYMNSADAALAPLLSRPEAPCSRMEYLQLLNAALPTEQGLLSAINSITSLPDTDDAAVLKFYNAGILTGVDEQGTFDGGKNLTRAECAAMVSRIVRPELRQSFVPQEKPAADPSAAPGSSGVAMTVNGEPVPVETLKYWIGAVAYRTDMLLSRYYNSRLDFTDPGAVQNVLYQAQVQAAAQVFIDQTSRQLGCAADALPAALAPSPSPEELNAYVKENDLLCAKHILVSDQDTAKAVLDGLKAVPTLEQFNALLTIFGTDPGMTANPNGYLFTAGEMVAEFEDGVRGLEFNAYTTQPVQSTYGYHIIWRLDPAAHPDLPGAYQEDNMEKQVNAWLQGAEIAVNEDVMGQLDAAACYAAYLQTQGIQQ